MKTGFLNIVALVALLIAQSVGVQGCAQTVEEYGQLWQRANIGLIDEFIDRFNGNEVHPGLAGRTDRSTALLTLFDLVQVDATDGYSLADVRHMVDTIISSDVRLAYEDTAWCAIAHCVGRLDGKEVRLDVYLAVQHRYEDLYKWVITRVEGKALEATPLHHSESIMLKPNDHETNFMSLRGATSSSAADIVDFITPSFVYDATSVFAYLVHSGRLKIETVVELEFVFTQVPGYIFRVGERIRNNSNSGWLITSFRIATPADKEAVLLGRGRRTVTEYGIAERANLYTEDRVYAGDRRTFEARTYERQGHLLNYINYASIESRRFDREYYCRAGNALFDSRAEVHVYDSATDVVHSMPIADFFARCAGGKYIEIEVVAVAVPMWDDRLTSCDATKLAMVATQLSMMREGRCPAWVEWRKNQSVLLATEDTENGREWMPLFGDLYVELTAK